MLKKPEVGRKLNFDWIKYIVGFKEIGNSGAAF